MHREQRDIQRKEEEERRRERERSYAERVALDRARKDSINNWSVPAQFCLGLSGGALTPTDFSFPLEDGTIVARVERPGSTFRFGFLDRKASSGKRAHVAFGLRLGYTRYEGGPVSSTISGDVSTSNYSGWWRKYNGSVVLEQLSVGLPILLCSRLSERSLLSGGAELRFLSSTIAESGEMTHWYRVHPDPDHPNGQTVTDPAEHYSLERSNDRIAPFQIALQLGYQYDLGHLLVVGLQGELGAFSLSKDIDERGYQQARREVVAGLLLSLGVDLDR